MELVILDYKTFAYKDHAYMGEVFDISLDLVITQKSTFKVNQEKLNASIGDYIYVKDDELYLGVIENIEDEKTYLVLSAVDFKQLFKVEVLVESFTGVLADFLEAIIRKTYITNSDQAQNLSYLSISKETSKVGSLSFDDDKVMTIYELLELLSKTQGINIKEEVVFENGSFKGILIRIVNVSNGIKIKADLLHLNDLVINDSSKEDVNKVTFIPRKDNLFFKEPIHYYLLKDGTITQDPNHDLRFEKVVLKLQTYNDNDYLDLNTKVLTILNMTTTDHQISFTIEKKNQSLAILKNLRLGDFVEFIYKDKKYDSILTGMKYTNTLDICQITLGEYRIKLTEKIQILSKNLNSQIGLVTINKSGLSDLDGGEY